MPTRPDLRDIASNVRDAFADADRDTLLDVLTFVLKEYVVEGPPPMLVHQVENLPDLANLSFAQLVTALQTRLDHPELSLFAVDGEHVSVRIGGVMQPLRGGATAAAQAAELPRPAAGVRVVEANVSRAPAPAPPQAPAPQAARPAGQAPPPSRGLSMRGRPSGEGAEGAADAPPAAAAPTPSPAAPAAAPEKKPDGDDASARFSLLELD